MNKKLIKKFQNEFNHWLYDGELIIGLKNCDGIYEWCDFKEDFWNYCDSGIQIIINDEWVEFRKALSEGKTIQWEHIEDEWVDLPIDFEFNEESTKYYIDEYRIKLDEQ